MTQAPPLNSTVSIPMDSIDQQVLRQLQAWLDAGETAWLCTIVRTQGSSPRPLGSLLASTHSGHIVGSLSGGCVEEDLLERLARGELAGAGPELVEYGVEADQNERLGLPCGGRLYVLVERMGPAQRGAVAKHAQVRRSATMRASDALFSLSSSNESTFLARARLASPCVFRLFRFSHEILHIKLLFKTRRTS